MSASAYPTFTDLHHGPEPLLLPNAWDVPSALAFVEAGYPAVGTTSFGVALTGGRPDGARASRDGSLRLARALEPVEVLLSVDIEDGYSDDPAEVAAYVDRLAATGVVGINLEDSTAEQLVDPAAHAAKIAAVKDRCPEVFVNARTDTFWLHQDESVDATLARLTAYVAAGADGVFVPGLTDADDLRAVTDAVDRPVNVLAAPGRSLAELGGLGVRRVSTGSLPYRTAMAAAVDCVRAVRDAAEPPSATPYDELQALLTRFSEDAHA